ncbi:MAG: DUF2306 domain-containing protein [Spirosoma sp.]|nr:DUF2306 domain-containing protein [Spirosoma sp.]
MKTLILALLIIHVSAGFTALIVGLIPMFAQKGGRLHNRAGLVYVYCMITVAVTALLLCGLQPFKMLRLFLTGIAIFSFYLCMTGWRATKQKKSGPARVDKWLTYGTLVVSVAMAVFGTYLLTGGLSVFAFLFVVFGFLTFRNAWHDHKSFGTKPEKMRWFYHHIARMGGSYIATFTAFLVNNVYRMLPDNAPGWMGAISWVAPALIGGVLIGRTITHYKGKFGAKPTTITVPVAA